MASIKKSRIKVCWLILLAGIWYSSIAEVVLDGSMGPAGSLPLSGGVNYRIFQSYGQTAGTNLFHSFSRFNIGLGQAATFEGSASIDNIFARVTGGLSTTINGLLTSTVPSANLWLINPNGILFGPHASINVNGSFYVSTANYLKFSDGFSFGTSPASSPLLTTSAPEAFGFLGPNPAPITFAGSGSDTVLNTPHPFAVSAREYLSAYYASKGLTWNDMKVSSGETFAIVGGDIHINDGQLNNGVPVATRLQAPGGRLELVSVASAGEVRSNVQQIDLTTFPNAGNIDINSSSQGAMLTTSGTGGGEIVIRGGELTLNNAFLVSDTFDNAAGKSVDIQVTGDLSITGTGAGVYTRSFGAGKGPDISVEAGNLGLSHQATIKSGAAGSGDGGNISIRTDTLDVASGSSIVSVKSSASGGRGGDVMIDADTIQLSEASQVLSYTSGSGDGGDISIRADVLDVESGSSIVSETEVFSSGRGAMF